jgi:flagellar protein FliS
MNHQDAAQAYRRTAIEDAPPVKIVRMLYAGAIRFLDQALAQDPSDPNSTFVDRLHRADRIVTELRLALIHDHAPSLGENLESLYLFVEARLAQAAVQRGPEPVREAKLILERLQGAWDLVGGASQ